MIIAVDFDGTLEEKGAPNYLLISELRARQARGDCIILWTCRTGKRLSEAVSFLRKSGLVPNYINQNAPQAVAMLGADPRKIYADVYVDDKNISMIRPTQ